MMGWFDGFDHYVVEKDLDLAAWDDYVGQGHLDPARNGFAHDLTRGFKGKNFWVMETQPGSVNWAPVNNSLDKGEVRAMAWHAVGHGADVVSYWQWRSALNGQEEYHGTLVGADGTPVPLYAEAQQIGQEFAKAGPALAGTSVKSEVAILHSYDSRWAIDWQRHNKNYDPAAELVSYYGPLRAISQSIDVVEPVASLSQYKLVVAPGLNVLSDAAAKNLIDYVRQGGHLVLGQRSAMKDEDNGLQPQRQPGPLSRSAGRTSRAVLRSARSGCDRRKVRLGQSKLWAELLSANDKDTEVLETYGKSNGWLDGKPAAITRKVGKGRITYIGAWLDGSAMTAAAKWMTDISGVKPALGAVPDGVEVYPRYGDHGVVYILVNLSKAEQTVSLPSAMNGCARRRIETVGQAARVWGGGVVEINVRASGLLASSQSQPKAEQELGARSHKLHSLAHPGEQLLEVRGSGRCCSARQCRADRHGFIVAFEPHQEGRFLGSGQALLIQIGVVRAHVGIHQRTRWIKFGIGAGFPTATRSSACCRWRGAKRTSNVSGWARRKVSRAAHCAKVVLKIWVPEPSVSSLT